MSAFTQQELSELYSTIQGAVSEVPALRAISYWDLPEKVVNFIEQAERPSVLYRPALSIDGNMWSALYGANLQEGVAGFGETPEKAMLDFDKNWRSAK